MLANRRNCSDIACCCCCCYHSATRVSERDKEKFPKMKCHTSENEMQRAHKHRARANIPCESEKGIQQTFIALSRNQSNPQRRPIHFRARKRKKEQSNKRTYHWKKVVKRVPGGHYLVIASFQVGFARYQHPIGLLFLLFHHDGSPRSCVAFSQK